MKILILSGSPRAKGNSNMLCDEFSRGAKEAGHTVEKIIVSRKKIAGCLGCNYCVKNNGICVQKDDMEDIKVKMLEADIIVLASPIYFYSMSAQLKLVLDRSYAFFRQLAGKTFYYIFSCAAPDASYTDTLIDSMNGFTRCVPDSKVAGIIQGFCTMNAGDVVDTKAYQDAFEMGKSL